MSKTTRVQGFCELHALDRATHGELHALDRATHGVGRNLGRRLVRLGARGPSDARTVARPRRMNRGGG